MVLFVKNFTGFPVDNNIPGVPSMFRKSTHTPFYCMCPSCAPAGIVWVRYMYLPVSPICCFPCIVTAASVGRGWGLWDGLGGFIGVSWLERHLYVTCIWVQNPSNPLRVSMLVHVYKVWQFWVQRWESIRAQDTYSKGECEWKCSSEHTWGPGHVINWDSCKLLDKENHSKKRKRLESFYICQ